MPTDTPVEYDHQVQIAARVGYCRYDSFGFTTGGAEVGVRVAGGLHVIGGAELFVVKRVLSPEKQIETGLYSVWNQLLPLNLGAVYVFGDDKLLPYAGADLITASYLQEDSKSYFAFGGRLRGGIDYMLASHVGLNLNLAVGAWAGSKWDVVEEGTASFGLLPQVSAGVMFAF
ncbi:MAG: hypothetical protein ABMB14_14890 [Myxococcota bacterium]